MVRLETLLGLGLWGLGLRVITPNKFLVSILLSISFPFDSPLLEYITKPLNVQGLGNVLVSYFSKG